MGAYYNEFDPKAAQWLRQLIKNGVIADGEVDERSIIDVQADDLRGFTQHHFFAGIGGWSYALRLAGWDDTRPVCTASLPCQPFSVAGSQKGIDDERHLLPHFIELVKQCNFQTIFGEQVPGAIKHGWLDDLCTEMEREKYTVGQIVLTAAGEGAPHIRQRLYWVADSNGKQRQQRLQQMERGQAERIGSNSIDSIMADSINKGSQGWLSGGQDTERETINRYSGCSGTVGRVSNTENGYGGANHNSPQVMAGNHGINLEGMAHVVGWATPNTMDTMPARSDEALARAKLKGGCSNLKDQIPLAGFATPRATKNTPAQREDFTPNLAMNALSMIGLTPTGYTAEMKSTGQLNPALSRWLMGFPEEWDIAAIQASRLMPTTRKKRELCD